MANCAFGYGKGVNHLGSLNWKKWEITCVTRKLTTHNTTHGKLYNGEGQIGKIFVTDKAYVFAKRSRRIDSLDYLTQTTLAES